MAALDLKDKSVSYLKQSLPTDLTKLPSHLKRNMASPLKYVRKRVTIKKLAFLAFELFTARVYFKLGMSVMYGLFHLAWKQYMNKDKEEARTQDPREERGRQVNTGCPLSTQQVCYSFCWNVFCWGFSVVSVVVLCFVASACRFLFSSFRDVLLCCFVLFFFMKYKVVNHGKNLVSNWRTYLSLGYDLFVAKRCITKKQ